MGGQSSRARSQLYNDTKGLEDNGFVVKWKRQTPVNGQGIFIFNVARNHPFKIAIKDDTRLDHIALEVYRDYARFQITHNCGNEQEVCEETVSSQGANAGYSDAVQEDGTVQKIAYWLSYDRDRMVLKYGKGYRMEETTLLEHRFLGTAPTDTASAYKKLTEPTTGMQQKNFRRNFKVHPNNKGQEQAQRERFYKFFNAEAKKWVEFKDSISHVAGKSPDYKGSLPPACKELYENIKTCELDNSYDDIFLSEAIRHSIETEGCMLYNKLKEKSAGKSDPKENYLRITLGQSFGNSPGIPYVLEIWPSGHHSPIHGHGNANAIIKVLFGSINVSVYNKHTTTKGEEPLQSFTCHQGDVTWMDRNWFQTHQLYNTSADFCATLQCYSYDAGDTTHWPYFDYIKENKVIDAFLPNTDFTFCCMYNGVMREYIAKIKTLQSEGRFERIPSGVANTLDITDQETFNEYVKNASDSFKTLPHTKSKWMRYV